jgi:hypothetical protein
MIAAAIIAIGCLQQTNPTDVKTFIDCVKAGYKVTDTAPRECKTPDGRTFKSDMDTFEATLDTSCGDDNECQLVDRKNGFSCCHIGQCDQPDYSNGNYASVNREWYARQRTENCPKEADCGPALNCTAKAPVGAYKPACINSRCVKLAVT